MEYSSPHLAQQVHLHTEFVQRELRHRAALQVALHGKMFWKRYNKLN